MFASVYLLRLPAKSARRSETARRRSETARWSRAIESASSHAVIRPFPIQHNPLKWVKWIALCMAFMGAAQAQIALEPEAGGPDFKIQGEYLGDDAGGNPLGAQIIALGSGRFTAVFLPGGLPGGGWNGLDRIEAAGAATAGGPAAFNGNGFSGSVEAQGARFTGKTDKDQDFTLSKIMRLSPSEGAAPPTGATVLFDGKDVSAWKDGTASMDARKLFKPEGASASSGAVTKATFGTFHLHLEFRVPFMPAASGQRRGNSGVYLQGRDEVQVLDSFGNRFDNGSDTMAAKRECGAFFEYHRARINAAYPPLSWQTYDIDFIEAKFAADGRTLLEPALASVWWNGIQVQDKSRLFNHTLLGDTMISAPGPMRFQAYGDSVYYRNIWVAEGPSALRLSPRKNGQAGPALRSARLPACILTGRRIRTDQRSGFQAAFGDALPYFSSRPASGPYLSSGANGAGTLSY